MLSAVALSIASTSIVQAQSDEMRCPTGAGPSACVDFYGCIETIDDADPIIARGRMLGVRRGDMKATLTTGAVCLGRWSGRAEGGAVHARCDDGRKLSVFFQHHDSATDTSWGAGTTSRGEHISGWSGANIDGYLARALGAPRNQIPCDGGFATLPFAAGQPSASSLTLTVSDASASAPTSTNRRSQ
ncbi:MAG: hypothetical protein AAFW46_13500 [Pseudomonadota bacterium]